ncbi:MAG: HAD family hydrolase [Acidobacteria bacterium]|nr:HAD family hydrolase [Acidobacteriota bacterium]
MSEASGTVFLLDVDNTLLDNDRVERDLKAHLRTELGEDSERVYWTIFEQLRAELGYADYLGALQQYRREHPRNPHILELSAFLIDYPFHERLYPGALEVIGRLRERGRTVVLSDGDAVFQPRKIRRSGIWEAVEHHALVYVHKEQMLGDVEEKYQAERYVMVDDKLRILTAMKNIWRERLTTVFVRQGHYALDQSSVAMYPPADVQVGSIAEVASSLKL